jgi:alpha-tubulin suppressor-like RCC1 family protein
MKHAALPLLLLVAGCFSKPSFSGRDAGAGSDTGDDVDAAPDADVSVPLTLAKISAGGRHVCAIDTDTKLWCWGDNDHGQLGDASLSRTGAPVLASTDAAMQAGWTDIAAGTYHTCGVRAGMAYCWGSNQKKESKPTTLGTDVGLTQITLPGMAMRVFAGTAISCAILDDGKAYCWGAIDLGAASSMSGVTQLQAGGLPAWTTIALADDHACAIAAGGADAGRLFCWGDDAHNELGTDVTLGSSRGMSLAGETEQSVLGTRYRAVDATTDVTCAITTGRMLSCWGAAAQGHLLGAPDNSVDATIDLMQVWDEIAIDTKFACARKLDGTIQCWGNDPDGALGTGDFDPRLTASATVTVNGSTTGAMALAAGAGFACALDAAGHAWCWGANRAGELGNREIATKDSASRVLLPALGPTNVVQEIVAGFDFTCALIGPPSGSGQAYCWGKNASKQVNAQMMSLAEERPIAALPAGIDLVELAVGEAHVCGVSAGGASVTCWGDNGSNQLGRTGSPGLNTVQMPGTPWTAVAAGSRASCAIAGGELHCWGAVPGDSVQMTRKNYGRPPSGAAWQSISMGSGFAVGIVIGTGVSYRTMVSFGNMCDGGTGTTGVQNADIPIAIKKGMFASVNDEYALLVIAASQHEGHHTCIHYTTQENSTPRVTCFGHNESQQVNETEASCNGNSADQTAVAWRMPVIGTRSVSTANAHSCALAANNSLQCWGGNNAHELADRSVSNRGTPEQVPPSNAGPWSSVATGNNHTCVIDDARRAVYCWGENRHGQLGDGTRFRPSPVASGLVSP